MNNLLKRAAACMAAAGILFTSPAVHCEAPARQSEKRALPVSVRTEEPVTDRLDRLSGGTLGDAELDTLCNEILAEAEQSRQTAGTPAVVKGSAELTARQEAHDAELRKRAAKVSILTGKLRSGAASEQELAELREILYPDAALYQSDATPSEAVPNTAPRMTEGVPVSRAQTLRSDAPSSADLVLKGETEIPESLSEKAKELGSANAIYRYLRSNIKYEIYRNSKKGAAVTFEQLGGNDMDQASLLIAMLRSIGIPARYVSGSIEITAQQAMEITGTENIESAGRILAASFDNVSGLTSGGTVTGYRMEHTWAEAYVPYTNYRGAGECTGESIWLPLDISFKPLETVKTEFDTEYTDEERAKYAELAALAEEYPMIYDTPEPLKEQEELMSQQIIPTEDQYLPATLPYQVLEVTDSYSALPDSKRSALKIAVGGETLLDAPLSELYAKRIVLSYEPATETDRQLMPADGDLTKVPAYLVHVVPVLSVDDKNYKGKRELSLGTAQQMLTTVSGDSGDSILTDVVRAGSVYAVTLNYEKIGLADIMLAGTRLQSTVNAAKEGTATTQEVLAAVLDNIGKNYFTYCDLRSVTNAMLYHVQKNRELGIVITGYEYDTDTTLGVCNALKGGSFMMDVAYNRFRTVSLENDANAEIIFNMALAATESYYEGAVWEDLTDNMLSGLSTVAVMNEAEKLNVPVVLVCAANADEVLDTCTVSSEVKREVRDFVNKGLFVRLVSQTLNIGSWTGTAYTALDMETGACSYMLSGGTAGGAAFDRCNFDEWSTESLLDFNLLLFKMGLAIADCRFAMTTAVFEFEAWVTLTMPLASNMGGAAKAVFKSEKQVGTAMQMYYDTVGFILDYAFEGEGIHDRLVKFTKQNMHKILEVLRDFPFDFILSCFKLGDFIMDDKVDIGPIVSAVAGVFPIIDDAMGDQNGIAMDAMSAYNLGSSWKKAVNQIFELIAARKS